MATRFYLPATAAPTAGLTPAIQGAWTITSNIARAMMSTTKIGDTIASVDYTDASAADQSIIFRQWLSPELTAGQTFTGGQVWALQVRGSETATGNNLFVARLLSVIASDGSTLRKAAVALSLDNMELLTTLTNRVNGGTTAATNYTTQTGDRLLLELGVSGDPSGGGSPNHSSSLSFGDSGASDLPVDDTDTGVKNPWLELTDTLTFVDPTLALTGTAASALYETEIVAGGQTIILTLTGASWISAALFNAQRQNIINGMDSAQSEALGWDNVVKALQGVAGVVRTSDTVVTITLDAQATYLITANETITVTIPASAISGGVGSVASPTFVVNNGAPPAGGGPIIGGGPLIKGALIRGGRLVA